MTHCDTMHQFIEYGRTMFKSIKPYFARAILSPKHLLRKRQTFERRRLRNNEPHRVTVYLRINDAHSYLLLQALSELQTRYQLHYEFRTVLALQQDAYPAPALWAENAFNDCAYLANLYADIIDEPRFPKALPKSTADRDTRVTHQLLEFESQGNYLTQALALFHAYWNNDQSIDSLLDTPLLRSSTHYQQLLLDNQEMLKNNGHYLSGILHYGDEWYWGLNRLQHFERRINQLESTASENKKVVYDRSHRYFCRAMDQGEVTIHTTQRDCEYELEMTYSARSPYSYLGLLRARKLARHYNLRLTIKPVLPMLMRGMQVSRQKSRYIISDVCREAAQHDIPFGFVADPLGKGVENTYALFEYAKSQRLEVEFLESVARGVWAEGVRSDTERGLSKLVSRTGLDWSIAKTHLADNSWRIWAQDNLLKLTTDNQWGVPCFKFNETSVFGQDRLDRIEQEIANTLRCE